MTHLAVLTGSSRQSPLVILRRVYYELTENHCAAKLIEYFRHWREWKVKNHRTDWVYMPLRQIHEDLMGEHSLHVIRAAIARLEKLGFLTKRNNPGNGQDKTYQYQLQVDVIASRLPETAKRKEEIPERRNECSENNVEQHTQITSTDIQNTNITPTENVSVKKSFGGEEEQLQAEDEEVQKSTEFLLEKYYESLKKLGVHQIAWNEKEQVYTEEPKMQRIIHALTKMKVDVAERGIQAFIRWGNDPQAKQIKNVYAGLYSCLTRTD